jgi:TfoX/Sxy family transcriptional regulator of competence genes
MSLDEELLGRVRCMLAGRAEIVERKMVGGISFLLGGQMCCGVTAGGLMVRIGPAAREEALAEPHATAMEFGGRPLAGFVCVAPEAIRTDAALAEWIRRGLDFVATLPPKKPSR